MLNRENVIATFLFVNGPSLEATTNIGLYSLPRNIQYFIFIHTYRGILMEGLILVFPQMAPKRPHHIPLLYTLDFKNLINIISVTKC